MEITKKVELRMPAGTLAGLKEAVENGADAVYVGFRAPTNARNFPGLNFSLEELKKGIEFAHRRGKKIYVTVNTYPQIGELDDCYKCVQAAYSVGADAIIVSDLSALEFVRNNFPNFPIHLSVLASACNAQAIEFYEREFGIKSVTLPRVMHLDEIRELRALTSVELEIFAYGVLCINCEGRCYLSPYLTGVSNNTYGMCSPSDFVVFNWKNNRLEIRLNGHLLNVLEPEEVFSYPTPCKSKYCNLLLNSVGYPMQFPMPLNILPILPDVIRSGVDALKIEGRQRSRCYVRTTGRIFRRAIDAYYAHPDSFTVREVWLKRLSSLFGSAEIIIGCYAEK
ncbi:MAG: peptidase U32 family protein [Actinomycetota bacterium]|nr:peptidase U32 family protein [Actinomycetota bacterium]